VFALLLQAGIGLASSIHHQWFNAEQVMTIPSINANQAATAQVGRVSLVGAGPGDPELLTLKALRLIESVDLVLFDRLVSDEIIALIPKHTRQIYVGKAKSNHSIPQSILNQYMIDMARQGLTICRLKGGDPFVFGRGSEEMLELKQAGIETEVVPGITAASGATAYAGIPLTHRGVSTGCTFITGHKQNGELDLNWSSLASCGHTLVFYMGLSKAEAISKALQNHGLSGQTPAALIERGSQSSQRVVTGSLATLASMARSQQIASPALIVVGEVVTFSEPLAWFAPKAMDCLISA
jgi:uroporphyrin-III C-methyltransferase